MTPIAMALSRFWTFMLLLSIGYVLLMLAAGKQYTLGSIVNGRQGELLVVSETDTATIPGSALVAAIHRADLGAVQQGDTLYTLNKNGALVGSVGMQPADGLFATCRNTITDLWLPLI
ncbi:MAG: hypothetical protein IT229_01910, partial [Flavobacteriales bacterium]|nr:hypothetical protein [Flavobacteriales bacterium]